MNRRIFLPSLCALGLGTWVLPANAAGTLLVIAHPSNTTKSLSAAEIEAIFTTRKQYWSHGGRIQTFNFPPKHPTRVEFDKKVLGMDPDEVARYWIDRRVRGGDRPPRQIPNASLMVRIVATLEGAAGYVYENDVTSAVKVIGRVG